MVTRKDIQATCDDIVREFGPLQVVLFGSYAYGTLTFQFPLNMQLILAIRETSQLRMTHRTPCASAIKFGVLFASH